MKKYSFESFAQWVVLPHVQLCALSITFLIILYAGHLRLKDFVALENFQGLESVTPKKIKEWGGDTSIVQVGMYINNWKNFDIVINDFVLDGVVWFQFNPAVVSLDTIGKFSFEKGELLYKQVQKTKLIGENVFVEYKIRLQFTTVLRQDLFPIDDHIVYIQLVNTFVSPGEIIFDAPQVGFSLSEYISLPGWKEVGRVVRTGYEEENMHVFDKEKMARYPKVVFALDFTRSGTSLILLILLPLFLIFFVSLFVMALDPVSSSTIMMGTVSGALTSIITYRFVIQATSPQVGYFLFSDYMFTLFLALSFMNFILTLIVVRVGSLTKPLIKLRALMFMFFHMSIITAWFYGLFWWKHQ